MTGCETDGKPLSCCNISQSLMERKIEDYRFDSGFQG